MVKVLVTGASGFIGSALVSRLAGYSVFAATRRQRASWPDGVAYMPSPDLSPEADWCLGSMGIEAIVHLAARVHVMDDRASDPLAAFRAANVAGTLSLARQAARAGVRRFVFLSSVKVNGEVTAPGVPFSLMDRPAPVDPYGVSKMEAEVGLWAIAAETGMQVVIIRPPLVYGPGVRANFLAMMRWLSRGVPFPFAAIDNRRSLVALDNLVDLIATCIDHPAAAGKTFFAADGEDLSTADLLRRLGVALGCPALLFSAPPSLLEAGAALVGKRAFAQRLLGSLQVDISATRAVLGWTPPIAVDEGLRRAAAGFLVSR